jgi:hypothetical protein
MYFCSQNAAQTKLCFLKGIHRRNILIYEPAQITERVILSLSLIYSSTQVKGDDHQANCGFYF